MDGQEKKARTPSTVYYRVQSSSARLLQQLYLQVTYEIPFRSHIHKSLKMYRILDIRLSDNRNCLDDIRYYCLCPATCQVLVSILIDLTGQLAVVGLPSVGFSPQVWCSASPFHLSLWIWSSLVHPPIWAPKHPPKLSWQNLSYLRLQPQPSPAHPFSPFFLPLGLPPCLPRFVHLVVNFPAVVLA